MLLKYFYDQALAHASYLVGCQRSGAALVVDPGRDIDPYLKAAQQEGLQLTAVAETLCDRSQLSEASRVLHKIGLDTVAGAVESEAVRREGLATGSYRSASPAELADPIQSESVRLVDVRSGTEWTEGHIPQAEHRFLGHLPDQLEEILSDKPVVTQCGSGARSAIAASILTNAGFDVINMSGGYREWPAADLPRAKEPSSV